MRYYIYILCFSLQFFSSAALAQKKTKVFNPKADGLEQLRQAISQAQSEEKHILLQVGGNWCKWCINLHNFLLEEEAIQTLLSKDYIVVKLNYSNQNENLEVLRRFGNPEKGVPFPILLFLDQNGELMHVQDPRQLEGPEENYLMPPTLKMLKDWAPTTKG